MSDQLDNPPPLCVDLDGTLINTDLLIESLFAFLRQEPLGIIKIPFWFARGKAFLKEQLVQRITIDVAALPYQQEFLDYLQQQHAIGRKLILVTASHRYFADQIARHLEIFAAVFATEMGKNLSGKEKAKCLVELYGERGFDYAGNSRTDLAVWAHARRAIVVNPVFGLKKRVPIAEFFDDRGDTGKCYLQLLHPLRWFNNLLVFIPLFIYQNYSDDALTQAGWAFATFSICGSSSYILSDLLNLSLDRRHSRSTYNLFSTGRISIIHGAILFSSLIVIGLLLAIFTLPLEYLALFTIYYFLSIIYHVMMHSYSVFVKTLLYMTRIVSGNTIGA